EDAIKYLRDHNSFEDFDRLTFLKKYINPLYDEIYEVQLIMGVETIKEVDKTTKPINYNARNIFDEDFLNPSFFTQVAQVDITPERLELGRLLFFDPILSKNNQRACASCHQPEKGFTDGLPKSLAFNYEGSIERNSPTIINAAYSHRWFYDMRLEQLEKQIEHVVFNGEEFNTDFASIIKKIEGSNTYKKLFQEAYGTQVRQPVSQFTISNAILAFVSSQNGFSSPVDEYIRGERKELNESAKRGFNLFMGKAACGSCHFAPTFGGIVPPYYKESESEVLGIPVAADTANLVLDPDIGRYGNKRVPEHVDFYQYSFKTVTVRNVALTAPYMHNGAYPDLESVVDFYNRGGGAGMGIDLPNQTLPFSELNLNEQEQKDLVVFMEHLTDTTGMMTIPTQLPKVEAFPELNDRQLGGAY
ncbi:MAG: cytochrome c peroxidase, partial [Bacteroidota bacterium]